MRPIPIVFHIGPLQIHTYGIGLAITFFFAYKYFEKRLRDNGYPSEWLMTSFLWIVLAAIVGARVVHVLANISLYSAQPSLIFQIWNGGLSSFGGLLFALPTGMYLCRKRCPELALGKALDLIAPVLMAAWALGRLLGPQLMVRGGGKPTTAWYGMYYAGQVGKHVPAPLFQAIECFAILLILFQVEKRFRQGPTGMVLAAAGALWGLDRFLDEVFWLAIPRFWDSVEVVGLVLCFGSLVIMALLLRRQRHQRAPAIEAPDPGPEVATPGAQAEIGQGARPG